MTIALVYRNGDEAFFINDFRITHKDGRQVDAMMKFASFDERFGTFFAGDVATFRLLVPQIRAIAPTVTIDNILHSDGPLAKAIESYMMRNPDNLPVGRRVRMLGFIVDDLSRKHECFQVDAQAGIGSRVDTVNQKDVTVIGSPSDLPGLCSEISIFTNQRLEEGSDIATALGEAKTRLKDFFGRVGPRSYGELGVSPVFVSSLLVHSRFEMYGEQIIGKRVTSDFGPNGGTPSTPYDYSFGRKDGTLHLVDNITGQKIIVEDAEDYSGRPSTEVLDPEHLAEGFDPAQYANANHVVYLINQWVVDDKLILRSIDKTHLIFPGMCNPQYLRLACDEIEVSDSVEHARYVRSGDHGLMVQPSDQDSFEAGISQHLFDHAWFLKHVGNYADLYV